MFKHIIVSEKGGEVSYTQHLNVGREFGFKIIKKANFKNPLKRDHIWGPQAVNGSHYFYYLMCIEPGSVSRENPIF